MCAGGNHPAQGAVCMVGVSVTLWYVVLLYKFPFHFKMMEPIELSWILIGLVILVLLWLLLSFGIFLTKGLRLALAVHEAAGGKEQGADNATLAENELRSRCGRLIVHYINHIKGLIPMTAAIVWLGILRWQNREESMIWLMIAILPVVIGAKTAAGFLIKRIDPEGLC